MNCGEGWDQGLRGLTDSVFYKYGTLSATTTLSEMSESAVIADADRDTVECICLLKSVQIIPLFSEPVGRTNHV